MLLRHETARAALGAGAHPVGDAGPMDADDLRDLGGAPEGPDYRGSRFHAGYVAHIATGRQGGVANLITDDCRDTRYAERMLQEWVKDALKHSELSQAELARRLTAHLHRAIDRAAVNKMTLGKRAIAGDEMIAIEEITGFPAPLENADGLIKVPMLDSLVSAGNLSPREPVKPEDVERFVAASGLPPGDWIALSVEGDSMDLVSPPGSVIFINRADTRLIEGGFYVVAIEGDHGTTYKRYRASPEHFAPYSTNRDHGPVIIDDEFRVVGRVYRTMLDIGPHAVRRGK